MNRNEFNNLIGNYPESDWFASAKRFDALYNGRGSQFRLLLNDIYESDPRAAMAFHRLGEIQVASVGRRAELANQHLSMAAYHAAHEVRRHLNCRVDSLNAEWLKEKLTVIARFHDFLNARMEPAVWGLADFGFPEFSERWQQWKADYCNGVVSANSLTRSMAGKEQKHQRLHLYIDNLNDNLPELRSILRDCRDTTGDGYGWWGNPDVVEFLDGED